MIPTARMNVSFSMQPKLGLKGFKCAVVAVLGMALLAGCGQGLAGVQRIDGGLASAQSRKLVKQNLAGQGERVLLRIPESLIQEVNQQLQAVRADEARRNEAEGPFTQEMIGGMYPGPKRPTYGVQLEAYGLHVSADNFKSELEELTYMNFRQTRNGHLEVPYWNRPGLKVSYYFTLSPIKVGRTPAEAKLKPVPLKVRYISNFGKNYSATLER